MVDRATGFIRRCFSCTGNFLVASLVASSTARRGQAVVACPSDGMLGPVAAPAAPTRPGKAPAGLALYVIPRDLSVLAPRGWHCVGLYGSSGSFLIVTPEPHDAKDFSDRETRVSGPVVVAPRPAFPPTRRDASRQRRSTPRFSPPRRVSSPRSSGIGPTFRGCEIGSLSERSNPPSQRHHGRVFHAVGGPGKELASSIPL